MDALHEAGIRAAVALQAGPPWLEQFWLFLTSHLEPKSIYTVCFPLARGLDGHVSAMVLWVALVAEWVNVVFKWFLFGERPYWWVHESGLSRRQQLPLRQFPVTCETGPGESPGEPLGALHDPGGGPVAHRHRPEQRNVQVHPEVSLGGTEGWDVGQDPQGAGPEQMNVLRGDRGVGCGAGPAGSRP
uniref:Uncharacterized protein n=1 Tax=Zosterops lateralis melanops TaxID=1220523 RepID=A0A8D2PWR2_ZOSLA